eukprot:CAMPEP_0171068474 /NCGR_PEP_ID=MMETSP0766_2-20121228/8583_1 /TAXON_ID=439317 /ORGANISM="Gambierdiscus australes, Strain CAWD 149" /LENGTH=358 /DNA_ID=CAMNT_0011524791 /DNA_START=104 /DNA_END=1180 /DNA_ORIENTATION=-
MEVIEAAVGMGNKDLARYVRRTDCESVFYFAGTSGPLELTFTDGLGIEHRVKLSGRSGKERAKLVFPIRSDVFRQRFQQVRGIEWHGDGVTRRTGVDPRSTIAQCSFVYEPRSLLHSHGIRIHITSFELEVGEGSMSQNDTQKLQEAVTLASNEQRFWQVTAAQAVATVESEDGVAWTYLGLIRRCAESKKAQRSKKEKIPLDLALCDLTGGKQNSPEALLLTAGLERAEGDTSDRARLCSGVSDASTTAEQEEAGIFDAEEAFDSSVELAQDGTRSGSLLTPGLEMPAGEPQEETRSSSLSPLTPALELRLREPRARWGRRSTPPSLEVSRAALPSPDEPTPPPSPRSPCARGFAGM